MATSSRWAAGRSPSSTPVSYTHLDVYKRQTQNLSVIRNAGEAFGEFQMLLGDFDVHRLHDTIPNFHDTRKRYEKLKADAAEVPAEKVREVAGELDWLLSVEDRACTLTDLYNRGELPLRVTHNDTKINNVLFDEETDRALVVIDLSLIHI